MSDSDLDIKREAIPENRTGAAKIHSARREARGFALWRLAIPMLSILAKALLWLTILW